MTHMASRGQKRTVWKLKWCLGWPLLAERAGFPLPWGMSDTICKCFGFGKSTPGSRELFILELWFNSPSPTHIPSVQHHFMKTASCGLSKSEMKYNSVAWGWIMCNTGQHYDVSWIGCGCLATQWSRLPPGCNFWMKQQEAFASLIRNMHIANFVILQKTIQW